MTIGTYISGEREINSFDGIVSTTTFIPINRPYVIYNVFFYRFLIKIIFFKNFASKIRDKLGHFGSPWGYSVDLSAGRI